MFLINSCPSQFTVTYLNRSPFSRTYGVNLQSSLTLVFSLALEYSSWGRVSVLGTGHHYFKRLEAFLGSMKSFNLVITYAFPMHNNSRLDSADLPTLTTCYLPRNPITGKIILLRHSITNNSKYRNINLLSIDYACRPRLRS